MAKSGRLQCLLGSGGCVAVMVGRSSSIAVAEQEAELRVLSLSDVWQGGPGVSNPTDVTGLNGHLLTEALGIVPDRV